MKKNQLLTIFRTYTEAARYFGIYRQTLNEWTHIPIKRLVQLYQNGLLSRDEFDAFVLQRDVYGFYEDNESTGCLDKDKESKNVN